MMPLIFLPRWHYLGSLSECTGECLMSVVFVKVFSKCSYDLYKDWETLVLLD